MKELSDLTTPAAIAVKPMLEAEVQSKCVAWAREHGYLARKFSSISQRSVPDYLMWKPGSHFWVEFKAPGKKSTDAQREEQDELTAAGLYGFECDNVDRFKRWVVEFESSQPRICQC